MNYDFIKKLLDAAEQYEQQHAGSGDLSQFAEWLYLQTRPLARKYPDTATRNSGETTESVIGKLFVYMNRYAKSYFKRSLEGTGIGSPDEFVFLVYLYYYGQATKSELTEVARLEKPSGMEVIRRLLQAGYVVQEAHGADKRSKTLRLTELGATVLLGSFETMDRVSKLITGDLNATEKGQLLYLLQRLEDFHYPIRQRQKRQQSSSDEPR